MAFTMLNAKDPGETVTLSFIFSNELQAGETITGCTVICTVLAGSGVADPAPSAVLSGVPTLGSTVLQSVTGGLDGVTYFLKATATTNQSRVLVRKGALPVVAN
jgi:hypothetical protein